MKWGSSPSCQKERYAGSLLRVEGLEVTWICVSSVEVQLDVITEDQNYDNEDINISAA